jgi:hypothetical protein
MTTLYQLALCTERRVFGKRRRKKGRAVISTCLNSWDATDETKMKTYPIVIVTEEFDPHVDQVLVLLREMGHEPARVHTADIPQHTSLSLSYDGANWKNILQTRTRTIPLEEVRSIWWRRPARAQLPETLTPDEEAFARAEVTHALTGMWEMLEHSCYWVSFPANIRKAGHKISQLELASRLGLQVPRTVVSTEPDCVRHFYEACHGQMIYKTLSTPHPISLRSGSSKAEQWKYSQEHSNENFSRTIYTTPILLKIPGNLFFFMWCGARPRA